MLRHFAHTLYGTRTLDECVREVLDSKARAFPAIRLPAPRHAARGALGYAYETWNSSPSWLAACLRFSLSDSPRRVCHPLFLGTAACVRQGWLLDTLDPPSHRSQGRDASRVGWSLREESAMRAKLPLTPTGKSWALLQIARARNAKKKRANDQREYAALLKKWREEKALRTRLQLYTVPGSSRLHLK